MQLRGTESTSINVDRDQITGNTRRSLAINYKPDRDLSITRLRRLRSQLSGHLETVINCTVILATWRGGWELSQHQQPVVRCGEI